jgi:hypothetical protein
VTGEERLEFRLAVHLSPTEYSQLAIDAILANAQAGDLLRDAYFGTGTRQDGDD